MDLKSVMLNEISQMDKDKNHMTSIICEMLNRKQQMNKQNK